MGSKKSFVKGIAAGAVLAAAASLIMEMRGEGNVHAKEFKNVAKKIGDRVTKKALRLGKLSKSAYNNIVDTTIHEYRGVKALSEEELLELRMELRGSWNELKSLVAKKSSPSPEKSKK